MPTDSRAVQLTPRTEQAFPKLSADQIARAARQGRLRSIAKGELLIESGAATLPFFVVTRGGLKIVQKPGKKERLHRSRPRTRRQALLDRFAVGIDDVPVLVVRGAVFLADSAALHVHMLVRASALADTMSRYLVRRIEGHSRITLLTNTEIVAVDGNTNLTRVTWRNQLTSAEETHDVGHVFVMTGAPCTAWLQG